MKNKLVMAMLTLYSSLCATPQAVVFDFGGVLTKEPNREVVAEFLRSSFNLSVEEYNRVNELKRNARQYGKMDEEFWLEYAEKEKIILPDTWAQDFKSVLKECMSVDEQMYDLVEHLKLKGLPVGMLSNVDFRLAGLIREFGFYEPFDPCLLSCDIGLEKPDQKIYEFLVMQMNLQPQEIVFIDDRPENVEAAKNVGLDAILFTSKDDLQKELSKRFKELY